MFDNLPQTILDELCQQYDLDDLDRQIIDLYVSFPKELRGEIKETHPGEIRKGIIRAAKSGNQSICSGSRLSFRM